jgi:hypothetical protein
MTPKLQTVPDLMPPAFAEGLDDWSRGDGTPDSPTYDRTDSARIALNDRDFGACLELRKTDPVQRLRYMGEVPIRVGSYVEITTRLKALRGPLPMAQIATWPGGAGGQGIADLPSPGPLQRIETYDAPITLRVVIGPATGAGVDLAWDQRALYAHVGLDLVGPDGGVLRIEDIAVRDVTGAFAPGGRKLPGFAQAEA